MTSDPPVALRVRRVTAALVAAVLMAAGAIVALGGQANAAPGCRVKYEENGWNTGFIASITITNTGDPWIAWQLVYTYPGNERLSNGWNATWLQTGRMIIVRNPSWSRPVGTGESVTIGAMFGFSGTRGPLPTTFSVNNVVCNAPEQSGPTGPTGPTGSTGPTGPVDHRVDNPYVGATAYVNPEWRDRAAAEPGGAAVSGQPTFVWLESRSDIVGTPAKRGLREHLDEALAQGAGLVQLSIHNLPGRECAKNHSTGEFGPSELPAYKTEFIDPIAAILAEPEYASLRIVAVIEVDAIVDLVANTQPQATATPACNTMKANGGYLEGIGYALAKLGAIPNVYNYMDAGHHGSLGWSDYLSPAVQLLRQAASTSGSTVGNVTGFIVNAQNYSATVEPFFTVNDVINGSPVLQSRWVDWNNFIDEQSYGRQLRVGAIGLGFPADIGVLIDTSRNGWGGPNRPTGPGPRTAVDSYVDGSRIDRRPSANLWCNQVGAGLGERPHAVGTNGIDAYVWAKPPGESDGIGDRASAAWEPMCDPDYGGSGSAFRPTNAMRGAPERGQWFPAYFRQLLANAYPPLG